MKIQVTIKIKLKIPSSDTALNFSKTMERYRQACNYVSEYIFNHDFDILKTLLNMNYTGTKVPGFWEHKVVTSELA